MIAHFVRHPLAVTVGLIGSIALLAHERGVAAPSPLRLQPSSRLAFVAPAPGSIVTDSVAIQLGTASLTEDIHLLVADVSSGTYQYLERLTAAPARHPSRLHHVVSLAGFGRSGTLRLVAIASNARSARGLTRGARLTRLPGGVIDSLDLRTAAAFLAPAAGSRLGPVAQVRAVGWLPGSYLTVAIRPVDDDGTSYWVQSGSLAVTPRVPMPIRVHIGGTGTYDLHLGVTTDPALFTEGARWSTLPATDSRGNPVYWIGPVVVRGS